MVEVIAGFRARPLPLDKRTPSKNASNCFDMRNALGQNLILIETGHVRATHRDTDFNGVKDKPSSTGASAEIDPESS